MAVAGKFGCMQEFNPELESFKTYEERLELYFEANDVVPEKQVAVFLSIIGAKNYALLRDLISPDKKIASLRIHVERAIKPIAF